MLMPPTPYSGSIRSDCASGKATKESSTRSTTSTLPDDKLLASEGVQFRMANKALIERMNTDGAFRKDILSRNPALLDWSKNPKDLGSSPPGMTWHHNDDVGRLNLVDRSDHGDNHGIYHPDGTGGRDKWGGGALGRKGKLNAATGCPL